VLEVLPIVLIAALAASLAEAFWVLPRHLGHGLKSAERPPARLRAGFERGFERLRDRGLGGLVDFTIRWRYPALGLTLAALMATVGLVRAGYVQREAIPAIDGDVLEARILMPQGTPLSRTETVAERVTSALDSVDTALSPRQPGGAALVRSVQTHFDRNLTADETGPHVATVSADLLGAGTRTVTLDEITARWREAIGPVPGAVAITLTEPGMGPQGIPVEIRLSAPELDALQRAADRLLAELETFDGIHNAIHDLRPGRPELRLRLAEGATGLGLTAREVADQVGAAFLGRVVTTIQDGDIAHEIEVEVAAADRDARDDLRDVTVTLPDGTRAPLTTVATIAQARGWGAITHVDGTRTVTVQADVDTRRGNADAIVSALRADFLPALEADMPGLSASVEGQSANSAETMGSVLRGFMLGLAGIYVVLSFQFRSYTEPLVVMATIPLALVGVVGGHILTGYDISMPSIVGAASLAGIVVNNAILLVQVIRRRTGTGASLAEAAARASRDRFRPVLVSVTTTITGLAPLLLETSTQAQTLKPLVISVVFGLLAATVLVLLVLPALYAVLGDLKSAPDAAGARD
jgi:multidrug efflux pump subunit AcrB